MKSGKLWMLAAVIIAGSVSVWGQTEPNLENGFKPYGSYDGTGIETVNLMNGNLNVHIPYPQHYPQRGGRLDNKLFQVMNSKAWHPQLYVSTDGTVGGNYWTAEQGPRPAAFATGITLFPILTRTYEMDSISDGTVLNFSDYNYMITMWDGGQHQVTAVPPGPGIIRSFEAVDGTGWHIDLANPDGNGTPQGGVVIDSNGNQYPISGWSGLCSSHTTNNLPGADRITICDQGADMLSVIDSNGNAYSSTDTMGRTASAPTASDLSGCVSSLPG